MRLSLVAILAVAAGASVGQATEDANIGNKIQGWIRPMMRPNPAAMVRSRNVQQQQQQQSVPQQGQQQQQQQSVPQQDQQQQQQMDQSSQSLPTDRNGKCIAPGAAGGPCLGGYRGVCQAGQQQGFRSQQANLHLCSSPELTCVGQDAAQAQSVMQSNGLRHTGKTSGQELWHGVLPLDAQATPRPQEDEQLSRQLLEVGKRFVVKFNQNTCPNEGSCPKNRCNAVAKQRGREFLSNEQCGLLEQTIGPSFGVENPWCAAFVNIIMRQWKSENNAVDPTFELPEHVAVRFWRDWAFCKGHEVITMRNIGPNDVRPGDLLIKSTSHIAIATGETRTWPQDQANWSLETIDGNTLRNGVPCSQVTQMPTAHAAGAHDASRNSGWAQYACRSHLDYNVLIRLRGISRGSQYKQRCWEGLHQFCSANAYQKCQNPGDQSQLANGKPANFCAFSQRYQSTGGCPSGWTGESGRCYGKTNRCCVKNNA